MQRKGVASGTTRVRGPKNNSMVRGEVVKTALSLMNTAREVMLGGLAIRQMGRHGEASTITPSIILHMSASDAY